MKKSHSPYLLLIATLIITGLLGVITFSSLNYDAAAAVPGTGDSQALASARPTRAPRPTRYPTAQLRFAGSDAIVSPSVLSAGVAMTYTMTLLNDGGTLTARNATLEIPWNGNQTFVGFSTDTPGWKLKTANDTGVIVDLGDVKVNQTGKITIKATFATNYDKPIFRQTLYLNWNDDFAARRAGTNLTQAVTLPQPTPIAVPDLPGVPGGEPPPAPTTAAVPTSGPFAPLPNQASTDSVWYFPATQHTLSGEFLNYWLAHGSVTNLGYPISEEFQDNGRTIQYFERVVMEFWPENPDPYKVLLRSLGRELNGVDPPIPAGTPSASDGSIFYQETGHWLDGRFIATWQDMGGLAQFGFPITEPVIVGDKLIQWTERARFELDLSRPDQPVMLGLVGDESAQSKGLLN
jgi:hypothetical protein